MSKKQSAAATKAKEADARSGDKILDSIFEKMSVEYSIPSDEISTILRQTAFKEDEGKQPATAAEMKALLSVAEKYKLNPFIREIFAFRNKKGVLVPIVSVDGWIKIMNNHPQHNGFKFNYSKDMVTIGKSKKCFEWMEIEIYRKDREYPIPIREYLDECYVARSYTSPWDTHTKRMLRHKDISQGVRVAYGVNDVYDLDEAERIDDALESEINRDKELEKPEGIEEIVTEPESVEPAPKVLNEKPKGEQTEPDIGTGGDVVPGIEPDKIPPIPPEKEDAIQNDIFSDGKTEEKETPKKEEIPDIF